MAKKEKKSASETAPLPKVPDLQSAEVESLQGQVSILRKALHEIICKTDRWQEAGAQHAMMIIRQTADNALIAAEVLDNDPSLTADLDGHVPSWDAEDIQEVD